MHDTRSFGVNSINLSKPYLKVTATTSSNPDSTSTGSSDDGDGVDIEVEGASSDASDEAGAVSSTWTHYDTIIFAHAVRDGVYLRRTLSTFAERFADPFLAAAQGIALIIWLIISPAAVLVGRVGRHRSSWFVWHSSLQVGRLLPFRRAPFAESCLCRASSRCQRPRLLSLWES
jgi:hypothetical protein